MLNVNQVTKPFLSDLDQEVMVSKFMDAVFSDDDKDTLFNKIISNNSKMAATASQILKQE